MRFTNTCMFIAMLMVFSMSADSTPSDLERVGQNIDNSTANNFGVRPPSVLNVSIVEENGLLENTDWAPLVQRGFKALAENIDEQTQVFDDGMKEVRLLLQEMKTIEKNQEDIKNNMAALNDSVKRLEKDRLSGDSQQWNKTVAEDRQVSDDRFMELQSEMNSMGHAIFDDMALLKATVTRLARHHPRSHLGWTPGFGRFFRFFRCMQGHCSPDRMRYGCEQYSIRRTNLVSIHSQAEEEFIMSLVPADIWRVTIGGLFNVHKLTWVWSNRAKMNYTNWFTGQSTTGNSLGFGCMMIYTDRNKWMNVRCAAEINDIGRTGYVCERKL